MTKTEKIPGTHAIAQRIVNAENAFDTTLVEISGIGAESAAKVRAFYLKNKIAKLDMVGGRISVTHGAYLDKAAILRAAEVVGG